MELIVITPEQDIIKETGLVNDLFKEGLQRLHVRKPDYTMAQYRQYINAIDKNYHAHIVIHGSFDLVDELGLGGIHLNSALRNSEQVWQEISFAYPSFVSTSFHSWQELSENDFPYGYAFISPVFNSISKEGYNATIDLSRATALKQALLLEGKYCPKIIGLGGVNVKQLHELAINGFDGAAMLGAIWLSPSPVIAFTEVMAAINKMKQN